MVGAANSVMIWELKAESSRRGGSVPEAKIACRGLMTGQRKGDMESLL